MSSYNNRRGGSDISWVAIIIAFAVFWPVGVFLLVAKLKEEMESQGNRQDWQAAMDDVRRETRRVKREFQKDISDIEQQARRHAEPGHSHYYQPGNQYQSTGAHPYTQHSARERMGMEETTVTRTVKTQKKRTTSKKSAVSKKIKDGKVLMIAGIVIAALFGMSAITEAVSWLPGSPMWALREAMAPFLVSGVGVGMGLWGAFKNKKASQFRQLLNMIGDSKQIDIQALAEAVPCTYNQACDRLQDMIDDGLLGEKAYIDMATGYLMLDGKGLGDRKGKGSKKKAAQSASHTEGEQREEEKILAEIRRVNEDIPDPELTRKIDRIEEITRHIFDYQKKHPDKAPELHKFLDYYLPTTLKILHSYAELDRQGVDGENISTTKERIESMMDKIVEGFETQLDKLFEGDMLDISSDISVMEKMLSRDGLSGGLRMPRGAEEGVQLTLDPDGKVHTPEEGAGELQSQPTPASFPSVPGAGFEPVVSPETVPTPEPASAAFPPVTGPELTLNPEGTAIPAPEPASFTTPGGIQLTLNPEEQVHSTPSWEEGFYRRTKDELEGDS